jgi:hypothetical protein
MRRSAGRLIRGNSGTNLPDRKPDFQQKFVGSGKFSACGSLVSGMRNSAANKKSKSKMKRKIRTMIRSKITIKIRIGPGTQGMRW